MKAIVIGSGAGGATAALELTRKGYEVTVLEAGNPFKSFKRYLTVAGPLRRLGLLGNENIIKRVLPHIDVIRSSEELLLFRGINIGGTTAISCGNMVRADHGLKELGLDLTPEFEAIEDMIPVKPIPMKRWRPLTRRMYESAEKLNLNPHSTPKAVKLDKCISCGLCETGCSADARWESSEFLDQAIKMGATLHTSTRVEKILIKDGHVTGVLVRSGRSQNIIDCELVVLAAGGVGTAQILKASGLRFEDKLWVDIVLTLGGVLKNSKQLEEPPMVWFSQQKDYIISPYIDILSHYMHKPWSGVSLNDRVGVMIKLADTSKGSVSSDGLVNKVITEEDKLKINKGISQAREIMELSGVSGPFVNGMYNGGHLGGTVPLKREDISSMKPSGLPEGLWIADLSLAPSSQGLPTMMLAAALAMRVCNIITE